MTPKWKQAPEILREQQKYGRSHKQSEQGPVFGLLSGRNSHDLLQFDTRGALGSAASLGGQAAVL